MTGTVEISIEEKKRTVRRLIGSGRGFAEEYGFRVTNNPSSLFQLLYLSLLLAGVRDHRRAVRIAEAVREQGGQTALELARLPAQRRLAVVRDAGHRRDAAGLADTLGELAETVVERYQGDLRRLRSRAGRDPVRERGLLAQLPGVGDRAIELFFREAQMLWGELAPFADRQALAAARRMGLGRSIADLAALAGRPRFGAVRLAGGGVGPDVGGGPVQPGDRLTVRDETDYPEI